ncbi:MULTISPECIES: hypothetical protein [unclassified Bosea (in: a-proteobacteria)]|uniref:DUF1254 domain-containing protein n=1 Tax=unclassified Bosea (in: a-proteobacteria) TaxID=2653178 RepID=UPI000F753417|nr:MULTISPECIES: hypothetical protein [unclassified Bosea (in: a-proteobacteria)]AZO78651.1 hypothetical protein BLM15_14245 [Bosea sp. Tri-49]RXT17561.1 hypothetical protein B5U98_26185 [Bosea sp. Tri-39]RXT40933.1 hypothetical protein B5U99_04055 [Bosea sp. Tri-54]
MLLTLAGLVLAGIVHIVTVLRVPALASGDAATVYAALGMNGRAELVTPPPAGLPAMLDADPNSVAAVCSYDLAAGPLRVVARTASLPLGLTVHRRGGGVAYAITDRAAIRGVLEFVVMTQEQLDDRLANDEEGETSRELRVVSPSLQGLVVARVIVRRAFDRSEAEALATGVACGLAD